MGDEDRHESRCSRRVTTHADPSLPALHCACRFDHLGNKVASPAQKTRRTCQRALQWQYITLPGSHRRPAHLCRRLGKRVCVYWRGVAKRLCPPCMSERLWRRRVRARTPLQIVRNGAYRHRKQIKYAPFPQVAPFQHRGLPGQSIKSVLPKLPVFICPLRNLTPTPKSAFRGG